MTTRFTSDWFSRNLPFWMKFCVPLAAGNALRGLEVGCFEGRSTAWMLSNVLVHPESSITCVDTFRGNYPEMAWWMTAGPADGRHRPSPARSGPPAQHRQGPAGAPLERMEATFDANMAALGATAKVRKIKDESWRALLGLFHAGERFDIAYVDGCHRARDVMFDGVLAWSLLRPGGILVFDDYGLLQPPLDVPSSAIDPLLEILGSSAEVLWKEWQVGLRRRPE